MPIRFRCAYCNQLMAIATRKAGTVVNCPKCQGQVIVPQPESAPPEPSNSFESASYGNNFNESSLPAVLDPAQVPASQIQVMSQPAAPYGAWPGIDATPVTRGIFLTPGLIILTVVLVLLLMGVAFFAGLLIGRG